MQFETCTVVRAHTSLAVDLSLISESDPTKDFENIIHNCSVWRRVQRGYCEESKHVVCFGRLVPNCDIHCAT